MPTVSIARDRLFKLLEKDYSEEAFDELCFEYGLELDEVVVEKPQIGSRALSAGVEVEEETFYKIEVPANRYDLLCIEGVAQALRVFLGLDKHLPHYCLSSSPNVSIRVQPGLEELRPYVVCAILRDIRMTDTIYQSLIDLQEKLHQNICRRRTLVAIGTHDMDTISAPFSYEALPPKDIRFIPLSKNKEYNAEELMTLYDDDAQLKKYLHIIRDCPSYPVIYDANRTVLSMPPIINGDHSKISLNTRNMFIECTATDKTKASIVLNIIVAMFSKYCERPFSVEPVEVVYPDGTKTVTPDFSTPRVTADVDYINRSVGVKLPGDQMVHLLSRMQLPAVVDDDGSTVAVDVPIIRPDILHACDVMCDVAIAYGFNRVQEQVPETSTVGKQYPINLMSDLVRREGFAQAGYTEVLTWVTVSHAENFTLLRRENVHDIAVKIANPKTLEFQECRTSLLPGLLKTLRENRKLKVPIRLFEVGDVVLKDKTAECGAVNCRRMAAVYCSTAAGFEIIQGLLDHLMSVLSCVKGDGVSQQSWRINANMCHDETFFPGRRACIIVGGNVVGTIGWIHPEVLQNFSLVYPCSAMEIDLEPFV